MPKLSRDGLYRRGDIFAFRYKQDGVWKEKYTGEYHREAALAFKNKFEEDLREGTLPTEKSEWTVEQACTLWVKQHAAHLTSDKSKRNEQSYLRQLIRKLGPRKLRMITLDDLKNYQQSRTNGVGGARPVKARPINVELQILVNVLKEENLWRGAMAKNFKRLSEPESLVGVALTMGELRHLESVAVTNDAWAVAYYAEQLTANAGLRGCEIKRTRIGNLDLDFRCLYIDRAATKTAAGQRRVELNTSAMLAARKLFVRAESLGACEPEHFLLPANLSRHTSANDPLNGLSGFDVTRHQKSWDTAWRNLRAAAARAIVDRAKEQNRELTKKERESVQKFQHLRFHDMRFTFITFMAERGVPISVVREMVGHMDDAMVKYYTRISDERQRQAVEALDRDKQNFQPEPAELPISAQPVQ